MARDLRAGAERGRRARAARIASMGVAALMVATLGVVAGVRLTAEPPPPTVTVDLPSMVVAAAGEPAAVTIPPRGGFALEAEGDARLGSRDPDTPRPVGSVAKTMTALAVLDARPLAVNEEGPVLTMTQADVDLYRSDLAADQSTLPVSVGEHLTERQLLLGLLLPSGNNVADTLARWVDGSLGVFTARLNARARALGMSHSHFDDASGFSPLTVATPAELLKLGRAALAKPALAAIVATRTATLPDGTALRNLDGALFTEPGWLGIKTGSTAQAAGCLLFAARRPVAGAGAPVTLIGAVLAQTDVPAAIQAAEQAVDSAFAGYASVDLADLPVTIDGRVTAPWGSNSALDPGPIPPAPAPVRRGMALHLSVSVEHLRAPLPAGTRAATLTVSTGTAVLLTRPLVLRRSIAGPGVGWRLLHG